MRWKMSKKGLEILEEMRKDHSRLRWGGLEDGAEDLIMVSGRLIRMGRTVRYRVVEDRLGAMVVEVIEVELRGSEKVEQEYRVTFGGDGIFTYGSEAEKICNLLNDGLRYRGEYKEGAGDI
jgi:hypothetical protein